MVISEKAHAECVRLLDLLTNKRVQESWSWVFMAPVTGIPGYHDVIKKPMDLGTVKRHLGSKPSRCRFKSHERFAKDVRLVFQNALLYNKEDEQVKGSVFDAAQHLLRVFENAYAKAKETVFKDEDEAAEHNSSTNEEQDEAAAAATAAPATGAATDRSRSSSEHESTKHKKDKSSKKDKKSKKSKKKSKDRDKEKSSSKGKDREKKSASDASGEKKSSAQSSGLKGATLSSESDRVLPTSAEATDTARVSATTTASSNDRSEKVKTSNSATSVPVPSRPPTSTSVPVSAGKMPEETMTACLGVLMKLIKYKEGNVSPAAPFLQPVDLMHFPDYKVKVPNRMHLYGVQKKLRSGGYTSVDAFAYDVRLVFSNCLVYNSDVVLSKVIRSHAVTLIKLFESQFAKIGGAWPGIPERWKCHQIIHDILADRTDGLETAQWFKYPIETYYDSPDQVPYGYFKKIKHPMDLGTVSAKLHLAVYRQTSDLLQDLKLIFDNCIRYWSGDPHGVTYCDSAKKLLNVLRTQAAAVFGSHVIDKVMAKEKGSKSASTAQPPSVGSSIPKERKTLTSSTSVTATGAPPVEEEKSRKRSSKHISSSFSQKEACLDILKALRQHKMKGYQGMEILTAGPFLHAVDVTKYPDYLQIVSEPMDFAKIERKLKGDRYSDVNEFSADVHLIFSNCHKYNSDPVEGADIRAMASNLRDYFVDLYNERFGTGEKSSRVPTGPLAVLPSAKFDTVSRTESAASKLLSPKVSKKIPQPSPPRDTLSASVAPQRTIPKPAGAPVSSAVKSTSTSSTSQTAGMTPIPAAPMASTTSGSKTSTSQMTPAELEEYKRRKKEKKEKKEKKDKKKKDKKEKKKKDKKDKERDKDKVKSTHSRQEGTVIPSAPQTTSVHAASSGKPASQPKASIPTNSAPSSSSSISAPPRTSQVPSKTAPAESTSGTKSKTKKSKKSELSGWEASAERVLNRLIKIEQVSKLHFDRPLLEVFPQLEQDYRRLVQEPMDLRTLRERLTGHLLTPTDFIRLGRLIFQNAIKFNCAPDPASAHVRDMSVHLLWYFDSLCAELKLTDSSNATSTLAEMRKERAEIVNNTAMEVKAKECQKLLRVLNSQKYDKNCWPFRKPVQVLFPTLPPEYFEIVKTPMDLATIGEKLNAFEYKLHGEFIRDVRLTFENAMRYNHADKDREGWNVYSAAVHMLTVVEDQWCDATLEVMERVRRREIVRKERERLGEKRKGDKRGDGDQKSLSVSHSRPSSSVSVSDGASSKAKSSDTLVSSTIAKASITIAPPSSKDDPESSTKLRLQIVNRPNLDRMNKSERKAEEKRRKRARREEEIARSEKRRRTAVAATDDALREAEMRSRRRFQKLEIAEAVRLREERERQQREEEAAKALAVKMKFNSSVWTGKLSTGQSFWLRKPTKLEVPTIFRAAVDSC